ARTVGRRSRAGRTPGARNALGARAEELGRGASVPRAHLGALGSSTAALEGVRRELSSTPQSGLTNYPWFARILFRSYSLFVKETHADCRDSAETSFRYPTVSAVRCILSASNVPRSPPASITARVGPTIDAISVLLTRSGCSNFASGAVSNMSRIARAHRLTSCLTMSSALMAAEGK